MGSVAPKGMNILDLDRDQPLLKCPKNQNKNNMQETKFHYAITLHYQVVVLNKHTFHNYEYYVQEL